MAKKILTTPIKDEDLADIKAHVFADFIGDNFFALIKDHFILLKQVIAVSIDRYN